MFYLYPIHNNEYLCDPSTTAIIKRSDLCLPQIAFLICDIYMYNKVL